MTINKFKFEVLSSQDSYNENKESCGFSGCKGCSLECGDEKTDSKKVIMPKSFESCSGCSHCYVPCRGGDCSDVDCLSHVDIENSSSLFIWETPKKTTSSSDENVSSKNEMPILNLRK
ncbi:MAG: hypothetical protein AB7F64_09975 [Gammaproteobacteria bacterium]